jgi:hypothetical protein
MSSGARGGRLEFLELKQCDTPVPAHAIEGWNGVVLGAERFLKKPIALRIEFAILLAPLAQKGHGQHNLRNR